MTILGNQDERLSRFRKVWIASPDVTVVGVYGPGTTWEITANWETPFENLTIGNMLGQGGNLGQAQTGATSVKASNTTQIWQSNRSTTLNIELKLYALSNPDIEVMQPLAALEYMIAPSEGRSFLSPGQIADSVQINIGTKIIYQPVVLDSISAPFDKEVDSQGRFVRCTINIQASTLTMVTREMLAEGHGMGFRT